MTTRRSCNGRAASSPDACRDRITNGPARTDTTFGILAGGRASRLGGLDKAWLEREGVPLVVRCARALEHEVDAVLVSANRALPRYDACALTAVPDRPERAGLGPVAALDALAQACMTTWLVTLPVDVVHVPAGLVAALRRGGDADGVYAVDDDGTQPLIARWRVTALRAALSTTGLHPISAQELHARIGSRGARFEGVSFGNLNTPADLAAAGVRMAP